MTGLLKVNFDFDKYIGLLKSPVVLIILLILTVPYGVFQLTGFVSFTTPAKIRYDWLSENKASLLILIYFLFVLFTFIKRKRISQSHAYILLFYFFLLSYNLIKALATPSFLLINYNFELFYGLLFGILLYFCLNIKLDNYKELILFFKLFIYLQIAGMLFGIVTNHTGIEGRYYVPNLDVGGTGFMLSIYIIYLLFVEKTNNLFHIGFILLMIFLTGSRTNMVLPLVFLVIYLFKKKNTAYNVLIWGIALIPLFYLLFYIPQVKTLLDKIDFERITAMVDLIKARDMSADESVLGRFMSVVTGIDILKENPFGLFFSLPDLQIRMQQNGYPTFPHCSILTFYLLMGPLLLVPVYNFIKLGKSLRDQNNGYKYIFYYITVYSIIAGGVIVNFKLYFLYIFVFYIAKHSHDEESFVPMAEE